MAVLLGSRITLIPAVRPDAALLAHHRYMVPAIPWLLFSLYWEIAAKDAAATETKLSRGLHVFLANVALLLEIAPLRGLGRFFAPSLLTLAAGLVVEWMGLFLAIWARRSAQD